MGISDGAKAEKLLTSYVFSQSENFSVRKAKGNIKWHEHEFIELVYVYSGRAAQETEEGVSEILPGDCFLLDIGSKHRIYDESEDFWLINCLFTPEFLSPLTGKDATFIELAANVFSASFSIKEGYVFARGNFGNLRELFFRMLNEYDKREMGYVEVVQSLLKVALITLFRQTENASLPRMVDEVLSYIARHADGKISVESLSADMFFSPAYISRIFKKYTKQNLSEYIRDIRLERVGERLVNSEESIDRIISEMGYGDKKSFYDQFTRKYGCTPGEYRSKYQK